MSLPWVELQSQRSWSVARGPSHGTRLTLALALSLFAACSLSYAAGGPDFERDVVPILVKRCLECHNDTDSNGGLRLTTLQGATTGGDSGPAIVVGDADASYLIERVASGEMPPEKSNGSQSLADHETDTLRAWIQSGAEWPADRVIDLYERTTENRGGRDWWSFQPVRRPEVPSVASADRVANPIDAFVLARLNAAEMRLAPLADKRVLIRRLFHDLVGLPPTWEQIEAFVNDDSPTAYERLVDRLLQSPHYGERWARYWLDLVRFAETCGYERDQTKPNVWKYRDWVIRSLNEDKPFDRFVVEQLAGDELADRSEQSVIATGFLQLGTWNDEPNDPQEYKYERLEDMVHATSTAFLGLTVKCARCHDHKFDPIYQKDYYRMAAAFWAGFVEPRSQELLGGPSADELGYPDVFGWTDAAVVPPPLYLLRKGDPHQPGPLVEPAHLSLIPSMASSIRPPSVHSRTSQRRLQLAYWITDPNHPLTPRVFVNRLWQHHFGKAIVRTPNNFGFKGDLPTHPDLLDWLAVEFVQSGWKVKPLHRLMVTSQTYRQASLHPLEKTYREMDFENRLWWHFDRRRLDAETMRDAMLAASGSLNLTLGEPSFHSRVSREALEGLSRKSEAWNESTQRERNRRSVYMFTQRSLLDPFMATFDFCDTTLPCGRRDVTTVAPQALALLNNPFVHQQSQALAQRIAAETGTEVGQQVELAWRHVFGRLPTEREVVAARDHIRRQQVRFSAQGAGRNSDVAPEVIHHSDVNARTLALASLCHVLFNTNEFSYVD